MSQSTVSEKPFHNSNLFTDYYLKNNLKRRDEWEEAEGVEAVFEELQNLYEKEGELAKDKKEDALLDKWIGQVLETLGYGQTSEPTLPDGGGYIDRLLYESDEVRHDAELDAADGDSNLVFDRACGLLEAKQWDADFTQHFSEDRQYRDASHQVKFYLEHTPETIQWGILTDGKKWRLYGTKDYETETYYQVDLPELLESGDVEDFKYFYQFFRPEAFREVAGSTFLDTVWNESETAAQELGEDLQDNVFTALRVLGKGFVETNNLQIDPDDDEALDELKEQSLVLLYRLMFVLYAESRHLIDPDDPEAQQEYTENFSLDQKRAEIRHAIDEEGETFDSAYSEYSTSVWQRLQDLFGLIDQGKDDLGIPAYNGGLFDSDEHEFLAEHEVGDEYIAEVLYRISTTENDEGESVLADYSDLDTRHLGSIYEGLLEHEFRIAPEEYAAVSEDGGQVWKPATEVSVADAVETVSESSLYVVNDEGERKATGSYYTPDYVVTYIVEETVDPLIDDIKADLAETHLKPGTVEYVTEFWKQVKDLKVLDPAMGSGHFLTKATGYIAEQVMNEVRELETATLFDEEQIRREVSKECIYGVDLNGMAVELAKLSMWLETLASDQPLAFLDHHLKTGNSLVGSDISEILATEDDSDSDSGSGAPVQATLSNWMEEARRRALEHVMDLMQDLLAIENESLDDIKEMEQTYDEIRDDPLFGHLLEMASVHTASQFGLDVPDDADEQMAKALRDESWEDVSEADWFKSAQAMADTEEFFHWELEFPEVFFGGDGEFVEDAGFDAVVGNPPWVRSINLKKANKATWQYYKESFQSAKSGEYDIYVCFIQAGYSLLNSNGEFGFIAPNKWITTQMGENLRKLLSEDEAVSKIIDFGSRQLFNGITTYSCLLFLNNYKKDGIEVRELEEEDRKTDPEFDEAEIWRSGTVDVDSLSSEPWSFNIGPVGGLFDRLSKYPALGDEANVFMGTGTRADSVFLLERKDSGLFSSTLEEQVSIENELLQSGLKGSDIGKHDFKRNHRLIFPYEKKDGEYNPIKPHKLKESYPLCWDYLCRNKKALQDREGGRFENEEEWYIYSYPRSMDKLGKEKIVLPDVVNEAEMAYDSEGWYILDTAYGIVSEKHNEHYLTGILNSDLLTCFLQFSGTDLRGGYFRMKTAYLNPFPIPDISTELRDEKVDQFRDFGTKLYEQYVEEKKKQAELPKIDGKGLHESLVPLVKSRTKLTGDRNSLNLSLLDHLGNYSDGPTLPKIGFSQPPKNSADSILHETTETRTKLQIERVNVERENSGTVSIHLTARYKPEDEDDHELDTYGYTETDFLPALRITDLTEAEADLVEAFVPVAVDEAGGFAGFRDNATKTNSLIDRLEKLTLPAVDDVQNGLESYIKTEKRAEELDAKIEKTDDLIDQIVYELYGLTDEEIEIVENAVGE